MNIGIWEVRLLLMRINTVVKEIIVSLIGRNHPFGILLASLLFGILYQGGAELAFETQTIDRHMVVLIQGLVILFAGALENLFRPQLQALVRSLFKTSTPVAASG